MPLAMFCTQIKLTTYDEAKCTKKSFSSRSGKKQGVGREGNQNRSGEQGQNRVQAVVRKDQNKRGVLKTFGFHALHCHQSIPRSRVMIWSFLQINGSLANPEQSGLFSNNRIKKRFLALSLPLLWSRC